MERERKPFSEKELINFYNSQQLGPKITSEDLLVPKTVKALYTHLVNGIMDRDDSFQQPEWSSLSAIPHPSIHVESMSNLSLLFYVNKCLLAAGGHPVSLKHLTFPDVSTLGKNTSLLWHFGKFVGEKNEIKQNFDREREELEAHRQDRETHLAGLEEAYKDLKKQKADEAPQVKALEEQNEALRLQLVEKEKILEEKAAEATQQKKQASDIKIKIDNEQNSVHKIREASNKIRSQIVRSPEKLKKALDEMTEQGERALAANSEAQTQLRDLQLRTGALKKLANKVVKRKVTMKECLDLIIEARALQKEIRELQEEQLQQEKFLKESSEHEKRTRVRIKEAQDEQNRMQRSFENKKQTMKHKLQKAQTDKSQLLTEHSKERQKIEENTNLAKKRRQALDQMQREHEGITKSLKQKYSQLEKTVKSYHAEMIQALLTATPGAFATDVTINLTKQLPPPPPSRSTVTSIRPIRRTGSFVPPSMLRDNGDDQKYPPPTPIAPAALFAGK